MITGIVEKVSGPLIVASGMRNANMFDVVRVGEMKLIGEIIEMRGDKASIQVYEETAGVGPGDKVYSTDMPLSVELGPGLIENIYDGVQRPLETMYSKYGTNITKGIDEPALDREKIWHFDATASAGEMLSGGDTVGTVKETEVVTQKIMLPPDVSGELLEINSGDYNVTETIGKVKKPDGSIYELKLAQKWPVRIPRPYKRKLSLDEPMVTGQRIIDALFPIAKGGTACVPGPFGSGKTVVQHQLAKWADVDIVVYIGCGERGNEMTDVLREFPELKDPRSGHSLMKRTVLIANTSDMPVAAREASIYTGITIAEYFRDMGYGVAVIADSTSRWAEALREMSGRLEEMPGEEGYPAYLTSRLAQFYERSGKVVCKGKEDNIGSITAIGAVSPTGGDLSEPVTQATLRIVKVFWGLDYSLAYRRHFPAINWLNSYSLYKPQLSEWFDKNVSDKWTDTCNTVMRILSEESELDEIVKLIGMDALSPSDRVTLEVARSIREDFLQQNAFDLDDSYTELAKQMGLLELVLYFGEKARAAIEKGADVEKLSNLPVRETIGRAKAVSADKYKDEFANIKNEIDSQIENLISEEAAL